MKPKLAIIYIRQQDLYPWKSIQSGLESLGYQVKFGLHKPKDDDLLITWTPWKGTASHRQGELHKANGGKWIVFENGYIPDIHGVKYWAAGLNGYNGWGDHKVKDDPSRWDKFCILDASWKPFDTTAIQNDALIIGQFGHRDTRYSMPKDWPDTIINRLLGDRLKPRNTFYSAVNFIYRPKPSRPVFPKNMEGLEISIQNTIGKDLIRCFKCFTWNSPSVAVHSLLVGTPVHISSSNHILFDLGYQNNTELLIDNRQKIFEKLAWTQWSATEICQGKPFMHLLEE